MNKCTIIFLFLIFWTNGLYCQVISFSDAGLENFLINENCVDTDSNGIYDTNLDFNMDGQIQLSEALSIQDLRIGNFPDAYFIKSIQDISHFQNLKSLSILYNDSLTKVFNLGLDSLEELWIGSCQNLKHIDISDLTNITKLRIEDIDSISYLNLKNGSFATELFSLFYSENIQYACVDSIAAEFNEVAWHMATGLFPTITCSSVNTKEDRTIQNISFYPNPAKTYLDIDCKCNIEEVNLFDLRGRLLFEMKNPGKQINIAELAKGMYLVKIYTELGILTKKIIKI